MSPASLTEAILSGSLELFTLNNTEHLSLESQHQKKQVMLLSLPDTVLMSVYILTGNVICIESSLGHIIP